MEQQSAEELKKYFNPKEYITKIIGIEDETESAGDDNNELTTLTSLLTDAKHKDVKEETLLMLKKDKKEELLMLAIAKQKDKTIQSQLVAACWESEINFSNYLPFFVMLAADDDYLVSLEAITVIGEMQGPFNNEQLKKAINNIKQAKQAANNEKQVLFNDLLDRLNGLAADV